MSTRHLSLLVILAVFALGGCKKKANDAASMTSTEMTPADKEVKAHFDVFGLAFNNYLSVSNGNLLTSPMVANLEVLDKFMGEDRNPPPGVTVKVTGTTPYMAFNSGKYKVFWSAPASQNIIACEKDAESRGGWVCLRMGGPKKMSAAEIQQQLAKK